MAILRRLAALVEGKRDHFALQIAREGGKPLRDAVVEVNRAIDGVMNASDELRNFAGREIPMGLTAASAGRWAFTTKEPIGVVAAISAFNHPLNLIVHQVVPAIAVGCPVIVKPAPTTPLSCLDFVALVHEAGLPEPWCQTFIPTGNDLAEQLATDSRVAFVSFIGSARVGWSLRSKLAPGTRSALEHGGAAPAIVDRSADLDAIIEPLAKGGYYHAGQVCVSTQRIFVHEDIRGRFIEQFADRVGLLKVGDPTHQETDVGPLILPKETDRVASWIAEARTRGTRVVLGDTRHCETTLDPTILLDPPADAKVSTDEIFGPVTCVYQSVDKLGSYCIYARRCGADRDVTAWQWDGSATASRPGALGAVWRWIWPRDTPFTTGATRSWPRRSSTRRSRCCVNRTTRIMLVAHRSRLGAISECCSSVSSRVWIRSEKSRGGAPTPCHYIAF
jgi:acyl-CoA reductase-like NAD-dependent aldehyde dehydrogenase